MGRNIFDFNHIADIPKEKLESLERWYAYYHKLATCYGWAYKRCKRLETGLKMTSTVLTVAGAALSPVSLLTLVISGVGVCVRAYSDLKNLQSKVEKYRFAHTNYLNTLNKLRCYLRGLSYDEIALISDLGLLDQIVNDICPPISNKWSVKYDRTYTSL